MCKSRNKLESTASRFKCCIYNDKYTEDPLQKSYCSGLMCINHHKLLILFHTRIWNADMIVETANISLLGGYNKATANINSAVYALNGKMKLKLTIRDGHIHNVRKILQRSSRWQVAVAWQQATPISYNQQASCQCHCTL
jgi:hypothetical protein